MGMRSYEQVRGFLSKATGNWPFWTLCPINGSFVLKNQTPTRLTHSSVVSRTCVRIPDERSDIRALNPGYKSHYLATYRCNLVHELGTSR
jgi:hypothetical protein